jgi:hypothetical protein
MAALKFRILLDSEENTEVFRDIVIDENEHFESFHHAIMNAFNFEGNQMASFYISNNNWDKGHEISLMDMGYGDDENEASVMSKTKIHEHINDDDQKLILVYDFLRMWIFLIELIDKTNETISSPKVVLSIGMAPPEDSKLPEFDDDEFLEEETEDDFDFNDFEDDYSDEDFSDFDEREF